MKLSLSKIKLGNIAILWPVNKPVPMLLPQKHYDGNFSMSHFHFKQLILPRIPVCTSFLKHVSSCFCGAKLTSCCLLFIAICTFLICTYSYEYVTYFNRMCL